MIDETLDDIQTMLNSYSFKFTLCDARSAESIDGSTKYVAYCGVLRDAREFIFETKRLKNILASMKKMGFYVTIHPEVKNIRQFWQHTSRLRPIERDEAMVCFIQEGLIQTFEETSARVMESLKRNFLYFQEDEEILKAEKVLTRISAAFDPFHQWDLHEGEWVETHSRLLRTFLFREAENTTYLGVAADYMEDAAYRAYARRLGIVVCCLEMICRGE